MLTTSFGSSSPEQTRAPRNARQKLTGALPAPQFSGGTEKSTDSRDELILRGSAKKKATKKPTGYGTELKRLGIAALLVGAGAQGALAALNKPKENKQINPFSGLRGQELFYLPSKLSEKEQQEADKFIASFNAEDDATASTTKGSKRFNFQKEGVPVGKKVKFLTGRAEKASHGRKLLNATQTNTSSSSDLTNLTNEQAIQILKGPSFQPVDINFFNPGIYNGTLALPAPARNITETEVKAELSKVFKDPVQNTKVMALMDDPGLKKIIPNVSLRAALVYLQGTAGEGAIDVVKNGTFSSVGFAPISEFFNRNNVAEAHLNKTNGQLSIVFDDEYQFEKFGLFSSLMDHEVKHCDPVVDTDEELTNSSIDSLLFCQILNRDPSILDPISNATATASNATDTPSNATRTKLGQKVGSRTFARINSRDPETGQLSVYKGSGLYPGGLLPEMKSLADVFPGTKSSKSTPGNVLLRKELATITGRKMNDTADFDKTTIQQLSDNQNLLPPVEVLQAAKNLGMKVPTA